MADQASSSSAITGPGRTILGINVLFAVLVSLAVAARFWSRRLKKTLYAWDDWSILAALVVYYGQVSFNIWAVANGGLGYHADQISKQQLRNTFFQLTVIQFIYAVNFVLIRFSICFLLLRLFPQKWLLYTSNSLGRGSGRSFGSFSSMYTWLTFGSFLEPQPVWVAMFVNVAWGLFVIFTAVAVCKPFAYNWDLSIPGGYCHNDAKLNTYIANAVWTIVYDTFIWALPQAIVWRLQMPLAGKIGLSTIFAIGIFDIVISILRITAVVKVDLKDVTYTDYAAQIWTVVEVSVAMIVACLPVCRTVIEHAFRLYLLPSSRRYRRSTKNMTGGQYTHTSFDNELVPRHKGQTPNVFREIDEEADTIHLTAAPEHAARIREDLDDDSQKPVNDVRRDSPGLGHTAIVKASGEGPAAAAVLHSQEPGLSHSIAVQEDVSVTYGS